MTRALNVLLIISTLVGGFMLFQARQSNSKLRDQFNQLDFQFGVMKIADVDKFYARKIETRDPEIFAWRIFVPMNCQCYIRQRTTNTDSTENVISDANPIFISSTSDEREVIVSFRYKFGGDHEIGGCCCHSWGSSFALSKAVTESKFLESHWEQLEVFDHVGNRTVSFDPDETMNLVSISIPEQVWDKFADAYGNGALAAKLRDRLFLQVSCGTQKSIQKQRTFEKKLYDHQRRAEYFEQKAGKQ